jgi:hypothetical protein
VRLSEGDTQTAVVFTAPAKGVGEGAARGAGLGAGSTVVGGAAAAGPYGLILGILLVPVGALVGTVVGAASAEPAAKVNEKERALKIAMEELKVPETFRRCVADALREQTSTPEGRVSSEQSPSTVLEVVVEEFGLAGPWLINPPLSFVLTARTRLIRASDGTELYGHWLTYRGRAQPLDDWALRNPAMLREESERACRDLAERVVDEVFLLYLPGREGPGAR